MLIIALALLFVSIVLIGINFVPLLVTKSAKLNANQAQAVVSKVDRYMQDDEIRKVYQLTLLGPVVLGALFYIIFPEGKRFIGLCAGIIFGYLLPRFYVGHLINQRRQRFNDQLIDAIMIMSSSFRGGLSLVQAFESVAEEMPEPSKGEFNVVIGENKMGVSLEESLNRFYKRMPSPALQQMVTAILLARETGGNLPLIFTRIVNSTRERKKVERNLATLTVQGKIQAAVMTGLPVFFFISVTGSNPHFFDTMFNSEQGRQLMFLCAILWVAGAVSIIKISTFKDI